jgi:hypothetical protein
MNFNLISPNNNGYDFQTRFREDVVIPKNSQVYLNFAEVSRETSINLTTDQTITFESNKVYPQKNYKQAGPNFDNNSFTMTIPIKAGNYSFDEFKQKVIQQQKDTKPNSLHYYTVNQTDYNPDGDNDITLGFVLEDTSVWKNVDFQVNDYDAGTNPTGIGNSSIGPDPADDDRQLVKLSANASPLVYDAFATSTTNYWHYSYLCDDTTQTFSSNFLYMDFAQKLTHNGVKVQQGSVCCGLYSKEYGNTVPAQADRVYTGVGSIITKDQIVRKNDRPDCFVSVEVRPSVPGRASTVRLNGWSNMPNITSMNSISTRQKTLWGNTVQNIYGTQDIAPKLVLQTYYDTTNNEFQTDNKKLYVRLYDNTNQFKLLFDSKSIDWYIPSGFFEYPTQDTADRISSAIPFNVLVAAEANNEGFLSVRYREFDKSQDTTQFNRYIIDNYKISFTQQLASYFGNLSSNNLFPNVCENMIDPNGSFYFTKLLTLDYLNESYTVYLEELPLKNYKNKSSESNGGYSQGILCNIPTPFKEIISNVNKNEALLTGVYQPNYQIISNLQNQEIRTNHFRVIIKSMGTDRPATELKRAVINFTIIPGTNSLKYEK